MLLPARQHDRIAGSFITHTNFIKQGHGQIVCLALPHVLELYRGQSEIFQYGFMLVQIKALKHHAGFHTNGTDIFAWIIQIMPVNNDCPRINGFKLVNGAQQGGLTRTRRPENDNLFPASDIKTYIIQSLERTEILVYIFYMNNGVSVFHNS